MKQKKTSLIKRIFVLFCCTVLLSSSIFMSYSQVLYAEEVTKDDLFDSFLAIAIAIAGAIVEPPVGIPALALLFYDVASASYTIGEYIYENSDGTYTVSEDFIQAVMDAAEKLEAQGFTDSNVESQSSGYLYNYMWTVSNTYIYNHPYKTTPESHHDIYNWQGEIGVRVAGFNDIQSGTDSNGRAYTSYLHNVYKYDKNYGFLTFSGYGTGVSSTDGQKTYYNLSASTGDSVTSYDGSKKSDTYSVTSSFGGNFPIFSSLEAVKNYLKTGNGYKDALNYRPTPLFRRHSSYTPTYTGGAVTVNRTVINNINSKITEVDADDSLTDDQKIEILQQYIRTGGVNPTPTSPPTPTDPDYDDNKDLPSGTDLTDTNSWLKKIYLKVCQIYAKMSDTAGQSMSEVVESIENLKQILKTYLSEITGDLDDIKGQLEEMSEQEFTEKTESFLDDTLDSFSEVSEKAKGKFPFSIPNDIRLLISKMSVSQPEDSVQGTYSVQTMSFDAGHESNGLISVMDEGGGDVPVISETGAPVFYLPFVIASAGIEQYVVIDLSGFEAISKFCRGLMTIWFILCLYNLTFKVMGLWGDLVD